MITTLINEHLIDLDLKATRKEEVFTEMARLLASQGKVSDEQAFIKDLWAREELGNTGFEEGVALPHAKSAAVCNPAVAIGISRNGIEYGAEDGKPSHIFFMIASPDGGANHHIEVLAELSGKLIEEGFIAKLLAANTPADALALLLAKKEEQSAAPTTSKGFIIGVTGCPAGIAHTYLAAESLERAAKELGYEVKVETNGSIGVKNSPTADEIARASAIVVACDKQVDMARFAGKPLIKTGGNPTPSGMQIPEGSMWNQILNVGVAAFTLMIPILAGYIAYAIGDRPALAPGFIGGWIANNGSFYGADAGTGFIGAIIAGLLVGYLVRWIATRQYHKMVQPLVPILIAPIVGSLFIAAVFIFIIGAPIADMMTGLNAMLLSMSGGSLVLLGIVLGGMAGFDMGGPVNKVAFLFSVGMIASGQTQFMGAMACAIPAAPLGMSLATVLGRKLGIFDESEIEAGKAAGAMGLVGISEGAIPFAARDPLAVIPANVLGSMTAAVMAFLFGITNSVAHGGPIVALLGAVNKPLLALLCMICGAIVTGVVAVALKKLRVKKSDEVTLAKAA
ncbi:PTS fructose transporter subunit IIABC [Aeromonas veronii]|uniref:PTS fructose transporter subunit IIABC n=1 Tax=Aeromonas veronii TaxID=654 RepID=UPI0038B5D8EC